MFGYTIENGRVRIAEGLAPPKLSEALIAYIPDELIGDFATVSYYESSWRFDATNDTRHKAGGQCNVRYWYSDEVGWALTEYSIGYFQINVCAHGYDKAYWSIPEHNVAKAWELYQQSGWRPWSYTATRLGLL